MTQISGLFPDIPVAPLMSPTRRDDPPSFDPDYAPPGEPSRALAPVDPNAPWSSRFGGMSVHDLLKGAPPTRDWIVKNALAARSFSLVLGSPGCGKSFLVTDLAMTMARCAADPERPREWFDMRIKATGVVYVAAEGQEDFVFRLKAWWQAERLGADFAMPFYLVPRPVDLRSEAAETKMLIDEIKHVSGMYQKAFGVPVGMVIVDTVNRSLAGGDDAKAEIVGAFIKNCSTIRDECGIAVLGVHHLPKAEGATDPRGHSSLKGDNDGQWLVRAGGYGKPNTWTITRLKAGPSGARHEFRLRQERLGKDEDGDDITSCVVLRLGADPSLDGAEARDASEQASSGKPTMTADGRVILGDNLTAALRALQQAIDESGQEPPPSIRAPHGRKAATFKTWLDEMVLTLPGDDKSDPKFRDKCRKARDAASMRLRARDIIGMDGDWVWRTQRRVFSIDASNQSELPLPPSVSGPDLSEIDNFG